MVTTKDLIIAALLLTLTVLVVVHGENRKNKIAPPMYRIQCYSGGQLLLDEILFNKPTGNRLLGYKFYMPGGNKVHISADCIYGMLTEN